MSFVSVNSERNTTKNCAKLFLLACAMVNISKERKRENSLRENVKNVDALTSVGSPTIYFFYLYFRMPNTQTMCILVTNKHRPLYSVWVFTATKGG